MMCKYILWPFVCPVSTYSFRVLLLFSTSYMPFGPQELHQTHLDDIVQRDFHLFM